MLNYLKQNTLALLGTMALAFGATQTADAQVIWGAGSTNAHIDSIGTFAATDSTFAPLGWTAIAHTPPPPGTAGTWIWKQNAFPRGQYSSPAETLSSPSAANGAAIFESNYFYDATTVTSSGSLISPIIDLTGQTNAKLNIKFHTRTRNFTLDSMHVGFSTNGGTTWTDKDLVPIINIPNPNDDFEGVALVGISNLLAGVTDLDSCRIRFKYKSDVYYWTIDDVSIVPAYPYDVEIVSQSTGGTLADGYTVYIPGGNVTQPLSQITTPALTRADKPNEWGFFGARLRNKGGAENLVGAAHNVKLFLKIEKSAGAGVWNFKMLDSISIDTLKPDSFKIVVDTFDNNWRPDSIGVYRYTYYVRVDTTQLSTANDTFVGTFNITSNIYSKAPLLTDGFPAISSATTPLAGTGNRVTEFEWGSMYYFPRGMNMRLDSVRYRVSADADIAPGVTASNVSVKVYKYKDVNGSGGIDAQPGAGELDPVAIGTNSVPMAPSGSRKLTVVPIDVQNGSDPLLLSDTTIYFVSIAQTNANGLFESTGFRGFYVGYNEINNYSLASAFADNSILFSNSAVKTVETGASPSNDWNRVGFGQDLVPSIALYVSPVVVAVKEVKEVASANVNIYPNPAKTVLNVKVEMDAASDLRYIMTDASGRVVRMNTSKNIQTETVSFDVEQLSAGVYFISVLTNKGVSTHRFVKE